MNKIFYIYDRHGSFIETREGNSAERILEEAKRRGIPAPMVEEENAEEQWKDMQQFLDRTYCRIVNSSY